MVSLKHSWSKTHFALASKKNTKRKMLSTTIICGESNLKSASLVYDGRHVLHDDPSHPETSSRATKMWEALEENGLAQRCHKISGREATREELVLAHTEEHIDLVYQGEALMDGSTYFTGGTPLAARVAAGCVLEMTRQVLSFSSGYVSRMRSTEYTFVLHWAPGLRWASSKRDVRSQATWASCSSTPCYGILHFQQCRSCCSQRTEAVGREESRHL